MEITILELKHFVAPSAKTVIKRTVTDYEIDFYKKGGRQIVIDGRETEIHDGDVSIRKPGQTVYSFGDYDCYILTLDLSDSRSPEGYSRNTANSLQITSSDSAVAYLPDKVSPKAPSEYSTLFERLFALTSTESAEAKCTVRQLLYMLNLDALRKSTDAERAIDSAPDRVYRYINKHFRDDITLEGLSELVHMDTSYLSRIFKKKYGTSPIDCVIRLRLDYASGLIMNTDMTVCEIADYCGYGNVSFFISAYKKRYGMTPGEHRKSVRNDLSKP